MFSVAAVVAFALLANAMLPSRLAAFSAVVCFAVLPRSYTWLVMGGGVTRAPGVAFALFALHQAYQLYSTGRKRYLPGAILFSAACVLSHLETGWFLAFSVAAFWFSVGRSWRGVFHSVIVAAGVLLLTAPWWGTVLHREGLAPFMAAHSTGGTVFSTVDRGQWFVATVFRGMATSERYFQIIGAAALVGGVVALARGRWLLPGWWLVTVLLESRAFATYDAAPIALLAGVAVAEVFVPLFRQGTSGENQGLIPNPRRAIAGGALLAGACYLVSTSVFTAHGGGVESPSLTSLTPAERAAYTWVEANTPSDARFLVMPHGIWETDKQTEWFPALSGRVSVATVQGTEWLPNDAFDRAIGLHDGAGWCGFAGGDCLTQWGASHNEPFDYVLIPGGDAAGCCGLTMAALDIDPRFVRLYSTSGGTVYRYVPGNKASNLPVPVEPFTP